MTQVLVNTYMVILQVPISFPQDWCTIKGGLVMYKRVLGAPNKPDKDRKASRPISFPVKILIFELLTYTKIIHKFFLL